MATAQSVLPLATQDLASATDTSGFVVVEQVVDHQSIQSLIKDIDQLDANVAIKQRTGHPFGIRDLLNLVPSTKALAESTAVKSLAEGIVGKEARLVRGIFFDKTPHANWKVTWHQDLTITVRKKQEMAGFGRWTIKGGIPHVQPPAAILKGMIALRIHLDDTDESNGALKVIPGSHRFGRLTQPQIGRLTNETSPVVCDVRRGGVLVMRPLLLHSSSSCSQPGHRRVIHLEFTTLDLPGDLEWLT